MSTQPSKRPGASLDVSNLSKYFNDTVAVDRVDLHLSPGSFTALLGPSGCGKSTLLNLIAGLETPDDGGISLDEKPVTSVPAERRPVGLVFQRPLLFPHLSVEANVAFGLRMRHMPRRKARAAGRAMLEQVELAELATRRVGELSGGQEQRVALARALVLQPRLLLLDEPFSALDAPLRAQMRTLVRTLAEELKVTTVFVTHDQAEAVEVADDIALMLHGRITAHAPAPIYYTDPPSLSAARFFAAINELPGLVHAGRFTMATAATHASQIPTHLPEGPAVLVIRPEALRLHDPDAALPADVLCFRGLALGARFAGTHQILDVDLQDGQRLCAHVPLGSAVQLGEPVTLSATADSATILTSTCAGGDGTTMSEEWS